MTGGTIAVRYATALLQLGVEQKSVEPFRTELDRFAEAYRQSPDLRVVLHNPSIVIEDRKELVRKIANHLRLSTTITNFLLLLVDKDRMGQMPDIATTLGQLADEQEGILRASVTAAFPLEPAHQRKMQELLGRLTGKKVVLETEVDPDLIGGIVTRVGGKVYDGSVRNQLNQIRQAAARQL